MQAASNPDPLPDDLDEIVDALNHDARLHVEARQLLLLCIQYDIHLCYSELAQQKPQVQAGAIEREDYEDSVDRVDRQWRGRLDSLYSETVNPYLREWCRMLKERIPAVLRSYDYRL